jgi:peptide/nickel transport system ATP-binding protein
MEPAQEKVEKPVLLRVSGLDAGYGSVRILKGIDLDIRQGTCTAIVGESGSGKTTLAKCLGGLHADAKGSVQLHGVALPFGARQRSPEQRRAVQYIFQNPYSSLNPRRTVHELIAQSIAAFTERGRASRHSVADLLSMVALNPRLHDRYPQQLSGGERQRVAIARAIAADPEILICDEITSALDVSVQASIVQLLKTLHRQSGTTIVFITHNLAVVRAIADRVAVVKSGALVEEGESDALLDAPQDPYTQSLLQSTPRLWWS